DFSKSPFDHLSTGEDPEIKQHREWSRRQRGIHGSSLSKNGCIGGFRGSQGLRGSVRSCKSKPSALPRAVSLESPKRLRFAVSEELASKVMEETKEEREDASPPPPPSPSSDDCTLRRVNLEVKRNSCPCIKEHHSQLLGAPISALGASSLHPSASAMDKRSLTASNTLDIPVSPASADEEVLTASRRTSMSEIISRPASLVDQTEEPNPSLSAFGECYHHSTPFADDATIPSTSCVLHSTSTSLTTTLPPTAFQEQLQESTRSPFSADLTRTLPSSPGRSGGRSASFSNTIPGPISVLGARYSISGSSNSSSSSNIGNGHGSNSTSRWKSHGGGGVPLGVRSSGTSSETLPTTSTAADVSESRVPRLRYSSKQDACSTTTDCEESSPLLSSVVNYRVINEVHKLPDKETPV
ncbi:hypothetical protein SK128_015948, partial [Halocaridina rubra]